MASPPGRSEGAADSVRQLEHRAPDVTEPRGEKKVAYPWSYPRAEASGCGGYGFSRAAIWPLGGAARPGILTANPHPQKVRIRASRQRCRKARHDQRGFSRW